MVLIFDFLLEFDFKFLGRNTTFKDNKIPKGKENYSNYSHFKVHVRISCSETISPVILCTSPPCFSIVKEAGTVFPSLG